MTETRIQRATSPDGTEIAARVHGEGPPLLLVHGGFTDGESAWSPSLPELTQRFACYAMSTRGRGLSGPAVDPSPLRLIDDVVCMAESIGEPTPVFGWCGGALLTLAAAERTEAISSAIAYEPGVFQIMDEATFGQFAATLGRVGELATAGSPAEGAKAFFDLVNNEEEQTATAELDLHTLSAPNVELQLRELAAVAESEGPSSLDPDELAKIQAPLLLLHGTRSTPERWFSDSVDHVARHVAHARVRAVEGAGHFGPVLYPAAVAGEIAAFLDAEGPPTA